VSSRAPGCASVDHAGCRSLRELAISFPKGPHESDSLQDGLNDSKDQKSDTVSKTRLNIETALTALSLPLPVLTVLSPSWIETVFGINPDNGDGRAEWLIVGGLLAMSIITSSLVWRDYSRFRATRA
jgi:hypothetical protein